MSEVEWSLSCERLPVACISLAGLRLYSLDHKQSLCYTRALSQFITNTQYCQCNECPLTLCYSTSDSITFDHNQPLTINTQHIFYTQNAAIMAAQSVSVPPGATSNTAVLSTAASDAAVSELDLSALSIPAPDTIPSNNADLRLTNFPIPRELRDQIYSYLLHSDYTRVVREPVGILDRIHGPFKRQGYRFHTNILAVNKNIYKESQEYLYKNNTFVVASAEWHLDGFPPGESLLTSNFWTPVVTGTHAAKMRHHSLRLHVTQGENAESRLLESTGSRKKAPIRSCVILANDLEALCTTLRCYVLLHPGFAILIEDGPFPRGLEVVGVTGHDGKIDKSSRVKIQFRDTPFRPRDANMQSKMFSSLRQIVCGGLRVTFDGALPEHVDRVQRTKDAMGPILVSRHACHWKIFEVMCKAKQLADNAVSVGELQLASRMYLAIMGDAMRYLDTLANPLNHNGLYVTSPVVHAIHVLRLDLALTLSYLQLRFDRQPALKAITMEVLEIVKDLDCSILESTATTLTTPESAGAVFVHVAWLSKMFLEEMHYPDRPPSITVSEMVEALEKHKQHPYHSHDLAILSKVPNQKDPAIKHLPLHLCSVSVLPPRHFSYHKFPNVPRQPDDIVGLERPENFRRIDHNTRKLINDTQRQFGQKVTKWD